MTSLACGPITIKHVIARTNEKNVTATVSVHKLGDQYSVCYLHLLLTGAFTYVIFSIMDLNTDLVTNLDLFLKLKESGSLKNSDFIVNYIKQNVPLPLRDDQIKVLKSFSNTYCYNLNRRWTQSGSKGPDFLKNNSAWLESDVAWPEFIKSSQSEPSIDVVAGPSRESDFSTPVKSIGISTQVSPRKPFTDLGSKQKRKRVENIASSLSFEEQSFVYLSSLTF